MTGAHIQIRNRRTVVLARQHVLCLSIDMRSSVMGVDLNQQLIVLILVGVLSGCTVGLGR